MVNSVSDRIGKTDSRVNQHTAKCGPDERAEGNPEIQGEGMESGSVGDDNLTEPEGTWKPIDPMRETPSGDAIVWADDQWNFMCPIPNPWVGIYFVHNAIKVITAIRITGLYSPDECERKGYMYPDHADTEFVNEVKIRIPGIPKRESYPIC